MTPTPVSANVYRFASRRGDARFALSESKLAPRAARPGVVDRPRLVQHLQATDEPVVAITAPPGYGKTTLLQQWADEDERPFAWLSLDRDDNDPALLLGYLAVALDRIVPVDPAVFEALAAPAPQIRSVVVPTLGASLFDAPPLVIALDDVDRLRDQDCLDALMALADHLPRDARLVLCGRCLRGLPEARLRAQGRLLEVGTDALALTARETAALLAEAGVQASAADADALTRSTEGWPAGVYLAAVAANATDGRLPGRLARGGHDRLVRDYLELELLSGLSQREMAFVIRTSVLERMSGPLCDAMLGETGSAALLESLERDNRFLVPLDREREWYRYHHLARHVLRIELDRRDGAAATVLNRRAAAWCEDHGLAEEAVGYAEAAGDPDRVARIVTRLAMPLYDRGGVAAVEAWVGRFDGNDLSNHPVIALFGAWIHALRGRPLEAERWADVAAHASLDEPLPDGGTSLEPWLAVFRAVACRGGVEAMRADAELGLAGLAPGSPWRPMGLLALGVAHVLADDAEAAEAHLTDATEIALSGGAACTAGLALAERALLAIARDDDDRAGALVREGAAVIRDAGLEGYGTTALLHVAAARCALRRGDPAHAAEELALAEPLRPLLTYALPWLSVQVGLELARAHIGVANPTAARSVMVDVEAVRRRRPELGVLNGQADELADQVAALRGSGVQWASTLTAAELRLLPLLTTHLSFREIGERLFVSRNTVKTEAISVYRKLGATSRSDAIERAAELGLVDSSIVMRLGGQRQAV